MRRLFTAGLIALAMLAASPPVHALDQTDDASFTGDTADGIETSSMPALASPSLPIAPFDATTPTALEPIVPLPWCVTMGEGAPTLDFGHLLATRPGPLPSVPPPSEMRGRMKVNQRSLSSAKFWVDLESGVTPAGLSQRRLAAV